MNTVYFNAIGGITDGGINQSEFVIKDALLLVEGPQKDNRGRKHFFSGDRVKKIAENTSARFNSGVDVPLMIDHAKTLFNENGKPNKFGHLISPTVARLIRQEDLPNPRLTKLVGKMGIFGKFLINHYVDEVKKGIIKPLSPGIDLESESLSEASGVAFPAIDGPALFKALDGDNIVYFNISYAEAKEQFGALRRVKGEAQECFDILFRVIGDIESADPTQMIGITPETLALKAVEDFYSDLLKVLGLDKEQLQTKENEESEPIDINPYQEMPQEYVQQQYSKAEDKTALFGNDDSVTDEDLLSPDTPVVLKKRIRN